MFRMDDGISPRDLKIDMLRDGLRGIRGRFQDCVAKGKKKEVCYAVAANELVSMFGSLLPYVAHDPELRYFLLRGSDGQLLVYDADRDVYKIVDFVEAVQRLLA
ncbi:hypothetical protein [Thermoproteus tenax]|nr:hypothetical protein [Thermoproteus tenax]